MQGEYFLQIISSCVFSSSKIRLLQNDHPNVCRMCVLCLCRYCVYMYVFVSVFGNAVYHPYVVLLV